MVNNFGESYHGHFKLSEEALTVIWKDGLVFPDTNVLLNLYRVKDETRREAVKSLLALQKRLRLPFYTGIEYFNNRYGRVAEMNTKASKARREYEGLLSKLEGSIEDAVTGKHSFLHSSEGIAEDISSIRSKIESAFDKVSSEQIEHSSDPILGEISKLFSEAVEDMPSQKEIEEIDRDGEKRYDLGIPPGFEDKKKEGIVASHGLQFYRKFGDLYFWKSILAMSKGEDLPAIVVTSDTKRDWWLKDSSDQILGVQPDLRHEFRLYTGHNVLIVTFEQFLTEAKKRLGIGIEDASVTDVGEVERLAAKNARTAFSQSYSYGSRGAIPSVHRMNDVRQSVSDWLEEYVGANGILMEQGAGSRRFDLSYISHRGEQVFAEVKILHARVRLMRLNLRRRLEGFVAKAVTVDAPTQLFILWDVDGEEFSMDVLEFMRDYIGDYLNDVRLLNEVTVFIGSLEHSNEIRIADVQSYPPVLSDR